MNLQKKNYEIIADELQRMIQSGVVKPGDKLDTIDRLAVQYRVGRSTIREALSHLKAIGLVESKQGGGTYVKKVSMEKEDVLNSLKHSHAELKQVLQVRKILEAGAVELAARYRTNANLDEMSQIILNMENAIGNEEISQIYDTNFHLLIAKASQNPILETMMGHISNIIFQTIQDSRKLWLYSEKDTAKKLFEEHKKIYESIREQDTKAAMETMSRHLGQVERALQS